jgi:hypothetical protein
MKASNTWGQGAPKRPIRHRPGSAEPVAPSPRGALSASRRCGGARRPRQGGSEPETTGTLVVVCCKRK